MSPSYGDLSTTFDSDYKGKATNLVSQFSNREVAKSFFLDLNYFSYNIFCQVR